MTIEEMKRIKQEKGYSVADISDLTGLPVSTVTKIFSGQTASPRRATVAALEKLFSQQGGRGHMNIRGSYDLKKALPEASMLGEAAISYGVPLKKQGDYTINDLEMLDEYPWVELIDGIIYDRSAPTVTHQRIAMELYVQSMEFIRQKGGKCEAFANPVDVRVSREDNRNCLIPDFFIVCDDSIVEEEGIMGGPDFVAEIVSPSSEYKDTVVKLKKYREMGVREYWIIDRKRRSVFIYLKDDPIGRIHPLCGKLGVAIYNGELEIDLDRIAAIMDRFS